MHCQRRGFGSVGFQADLQQRLDKLRGTEGVLLFAESGRRPSGALASIQPRTSLVKFARSPRTDRPGPAQLARWAPSESTSLLLQVRITVGIETACF